MTALRRRLAEAEAAVTSFEEAVAAASRSAIERDSAILRLIYSYQAVWKVCQRLLDERDNIEIASPNDAIRAARRLGWLSDEDAEAAMKIGADCNLAAKAHLAHIGAEISCRLPTNAAVLRRWLTALREKAANIEQLMPSDTYLLFEWAMAQRKQIVCMYEGYRRELCPIILGHSRGEERALTYQFGGGARSKLPPAGQWKCLWLFKVRNVELREGLWYSGSSHITAQSCVETVDLDVNPDSPYKPKRRLASRPVAEPAGSRRGPAPPYRPGQA